MVFDARTMLGTTTRRTTSIVACFVSLLLTNEAVLLTTVDTCLMDKCKEERLDPISKDSRFCTKHVCRFEDCNGARTDNPYCDKHTCEETTCVSFVSGGGKPGEPPRFCERHRRCKDKGCVRYCQLRPNGSIVPFCHLHCCGVEDCSEACVSGPCCVPHSCLEMGCSKERAEGASFCKDHVCANKTCLQRKLGAKFCPQHQCVFLGCEGEAGPNTYCDQHQKCEEVDCERRRFILSGTVYPTCEYRELLPLFIP